MSSTRESLVPPRSWTRASLLAVALFWTSGDWTPSTAQVFPRIVNGLNSHGYPTTGALMYSGGGTIDENNADSWCSGTLIGCRTFLTAAHCVEDDQNKSRYWVYLQHAGLQTVASITPHSSYTPFGFPEYDVAVIKLGAPVTGIEPTPINTTMSPPTGTTATIAGFGRTGGSAYDYGIKRVGLVETTDCTGILTGLGNDELVCWQFLDPVGSPGDDSNTCNGDSGGPLFADLGGGLVVAGVTSGGDAADCLPADDSYDANVFTYAAFILGELGSDSTSTCGGLPPVGDPEVTVIGTDGTLGSSNPSDSFAIQVTDPTVELRFALTGENNGSLDVDMYVKEGLGASPSSFDCAANGASNVGECSFSDPAQGDWSVFVNRFSGTGEYQVTTTIFSPDPPVCGNDVKEFGEECDGTDDAACPGECLSSCSCPVCSATPSVGCLSGELGRSYVSIRDSDDDGRDRFKWKLSRGDATDLSDFLDPAGSASGRFRFCFYENGSSALPAVEMLPMGTCDGRPCWKATGTKGFKYKNKTGTVSGITDIKLRAGEAGRAQVLVKGRGVGLDTPAPPISEPVTAQLTITDGETSRCWQTTFATSTKNEAGSFRAKGP